MFDSSCQIISGFFACEIGSDIQMFPAINFILKFAVNKQFEMS